MSPNRISLWLASGLLFVLIFGCRKTTSVEPVDTFASVHCSSLPDYFPFAVMGATGDFFYGDYQAEWEANYLRHMKEPSLYACGALSSQPEYRFLWDRSLSEPISVRLVVHPDYAGTLFVRVLANGGMIPPPRPGMNGLL